jgi:hypothetical protein
MANERGLQQSTTWREYIQASVEGYIGALAADPVVARAFQFEMDVIGGKARERRRSVAAAFAESRLAAQEQMRTTDPLLKRRPLTSHLAAVLGMREVACDLLAQSGEPDFLETIPELVDWVVTAWYDEKPRSVGARSRPAQARSRRAKTRA